MNALSYLQRCGTIMQGVVLDSIRSIQYWQPPQPALESSIGNIQRIHKNTIEYTKIRKNTLSSQEY